MYNVYNNYEPQSLQSRHDFSTAKIPNQSTILFGFHSSKKTTLLLLLTNMVMNMAAFASLYVLAQSRWRTRREQLKERLENGADTDVGGMEIEGTS